METLPVSASEKAHKQRTNRGKIRGASVPMQRSIPFHWHGFMLRSIGNIFCIQCHPVIGKISILLCHWKSMPNYSSQWIHASVVGPNVVVDVGEIMGDWSQQDHVWVHQDYDRVLSLFIRGFHLVRIHSKRVFHPMPKSKGCTQSQQCEDNRSVGRIAMFFSFRHSYTYVYSCTCNISH